MTTSQDGNAHQPALGNSGCRNVPAHDAGPVLSHYRRSGRFLERRCGASKGRASPFRVSGKRSNARDDIDAAGQYAVNYSDCNSAVLTPGGTPCLIKVTFNPDSLGLKNALISRSERKR